MLSILIPPLLLQVFPLQGTSELAKVKQSTLLRFTKNGETPATCRYVGNAQWAEKRSRDTGWLVIAAQLR